ncbi:hypothetical protein [Sulfurimonas sp. RIFOXYB12_FULL_35_9]|uniref:hypothetical protein n=1 Tax=Sulfurimonas sp. RIFOXYB12_FULL_35_9 TaxID=1802256 RepID=UPI0008B59BDC|nr:hypothetical protein [Sulfurimonas sp. RIFOXYB12_FULL_35_9]OHE04106.1 MAG: hypothetical protein A2345_00150 [Sulfurimonas sp. RIFOXYB12_FULL_35_9]
MKNKIVSIALVSLLSMSFSGCFNNEASCSGSTEAQLVEEIALPSIKDKFIYQKMNDIEPMSGVYLYMKKLASTVGGDNKNVKNQYEETYNKASEEAEKEFQNYKFELEGIRTTSKDKELHQVECSATVKVKLASYEGSYNIEYSSQLSDDKNSVYVEVSSLE